ncbi:hypothetical protein COB57_03435 [Candidatus Peregrinibacteria bacterium]|nr:MAG: hypothetical protein COB57_03435 [Candidatus Peregrinibacteria bacterium]
MHLQSIFSRMKKKDAIIGAGIVSATLVLFFSVYLNRVPNQQYSASIIQEQREEVNAMKKEIEDLKETLHEAARLQKQLQQK